MNLTEPICFAEVLDVLGYTPGEHVAICHKVGDGPFQCAVGAPANAADYVDRLPPEADVFFGVNPVRGLPPGQRGKAEDVTRLAALVVDLDAKPSGCGSVETAEVIVSDLAALIGEYPSVVVHSGGGLHAYWPVDDGHIGDDFTTAQATALLRRWGRLARCAADARNVSVDSVFDLARVLRVPGTVNHKRVDA